MVKVGFPYTHKEKGGNYILMSVSNLNPRFNGIEGVVLRSIGDNEIFTFYLLDFDIHFDLLDVTTIPKWRHRNGNEYELITVTNSNADTANVEKYPPTVVYCGENGRIWSKPIQNFLESMTPA